MRASSDNFHAYLTRVNAHLPAEFAQDMYDEGLGIQMSAYVFTSFMKNGDPKRCADDLVAKLGVEGE